MESDLEVMRKEKSLADNGYKVKNYFE